MHFLKAMKLKPKQPTWVPAFTPSKKVNYWSLTLKQKLNSRKAMKMSTEEKPAELQKVSPLHPFLSAPINL